MAEYIEREDALFALRKAERGGSMTALTRLERAYAEIREMPAADVAEVVHGRWIPTEYPFMNECEDCSSCGYRTLYGNGYDYCPNCGAKMDGGNDNVSD